MIDEWEKELDQLRTPTDKFARKYLGASIGPYIQGQLENGYDGAVLHRIRELRILIASWYNKHS